MLRLFIYCGILLMLSGCSGLDLIKDAVGLGGSKGIEVDAQIGDRANTGNLGGAIGAGRIEAEDDATVNVTSTKNDAKIERAEQVLIDNAPSIWFIALLVLGWILPTPVGMFNGIIKFYKGKKKNG